MDKSSQNQRGVIVQYAKKIENDLTKKMRGDIISHVKGKDEDALKRDAHREPM